MKKLRCLSIFIILLALFSCKKHKKDSPEPLVIGSPPEGYILLTFDSLETRKNYIGDFALIGDTSYKTTATVFLNEELIDPNAYTLLDEAGFYTLEIQESGGGITTILFVILEPERHETEWGLKTWTPRHFETSKTVEGQLDIIYPKRHVGEINIPVVMYNKENLAVLPNYYSLTNSLNSQQEYIKRGVGSLNLKPENGYDFNITIADITKNLSITHLTTGWFDIPVEITSDIIVPTNSLIHIKEDIHITGGSLKINQGTIVIIDEGVNIQTSRPIIVQGLKLQPVIFTCSDPDSYWGGIIANGDYADITAQYAFFNQAGFNTGSEYNWGHAQRQALFYTREADITLDNCYCLDHIGQVFYSENSRVILHNVLIQRAKTSGQLNQSEVTIDNCIFTDFPEYSSHFLDLDNDGLYINHCNALITNSTFMYAKDDGLDTGMNEGGTVIIDSCWFEGMFHEGIAMSSSDDVEKYHYISNSTFTNCGQGIELGFSSPNHLVTVNNCEIYGNLVGIRFGDCYGWQQEGYMDISNSRITNNFDKDIWNMSRACWCPRLDHMKFTNVQISIPTSQYPDLEVIDE